MKSGKNLELRSIHTVRVTPYTDRTNFHSIAYTTTGATVSTHRHTVRVAPYTDRVRRFWKTDSDLERSFIEGRSTQLLYRRDSHLQKDVLTQEIDLGLEELDG